MSYYHVCEFCGDRLDPGEKCECREQKEPVVVMPRKMEYPKEMRTHGSRTFCVSQ